MCSCIFRPAQLAKGMLALAIFISHGLNCYVAINITWTEYLEKRLSKDSPKILWEYAVRTLLVLLTCKTNLVENLHSQRIKNLYLLLFHSVLLAIAIPNLELFTSLFGALCLSVLGLVFPAVSVSPIYHWVFHMNKSILPHSHFVCSFPQRRQLDDRILYVPQWKAGSVESDNDQQKCDDCSHWFGWFDRRHIH